MPRKRYSTADLDGHANEGISLSWESKIAEELQIADRDRQVRLLRGESPPKVGPRFLPIRVGLLPYGGIMKFINSDGGRAAAGYEGKAGDCVCRAIAIATGRSYQEVYDRLAEGNASQRITHRTPARRAGVRTASSGISVGRKWFKDYMTELGFVWTPTMFVGQGCKVHLRKGELPMGRLVVSVSRHACAVINGILHDTHDCTRQGTRCVYGYWKLIRPQATAPS